MNSMKHNSKLARLPEAAVLLLARSQPQTSRTATAYHRLVLVAYKSHELVPSLKQNSKEKGTITNQAPAALAAACYHQHGVPQRMVNSAEA